MFACIHCGGSKGAPFLIDCKDLYLYSPFVVSYFRCASCRLVQQSPVPQNIEALYADYPIHRQRSALHTWFRRRLLAGAYVPPPQWGRGRRLLDFGCGDGWYLDWCREHGMKAEGFEYTRHHAEALASSLGLPVHWDLCEFVKRRQASFDIITLNFVAEHLADPRAIIGKLSELLDIGGTLRLVVPHIDSWEQRLFRRRWHSLDPPRHVSFLDESHIRDIAVSCGLRLQSFGVARFPNGLAGSVPTALLGRFDARAMLAVLPLTWPLTWAFPSGHASYRLVRDTPQVVAQT